MINHSVHKIDLHFMGQQNAIAAFLVKSEIGPILIETGPSSTLPYLKQGLAEHGYQMSDVKHVFLTHIHLDHAGAAWCFADLGAQIYLHPLGYKHMHDPSKLLSSAKRIYGEMMDTLWGTLKPIHAEQLHQVDHLGEIEIGPLTFIAHHTPGHAIHHIAWQIGEDLCTGDVGGVRVNGGPVVPPCPPPDIHIEDWLVSVEHIESLQDIKRYHLTHCSSVTDLKHHTAQLKDALVTYAGWVRPWYEKGLSTSECMPEFRKNVTTYMMSHGFAEEDANAYNTANPPDGSLPGLMRYWKKKLEV